MSKPVKSDPKPEPVPEYVHKATEKKLLAEARHADAMALGDEINNRIAAYQADEIDLGQGYKNADDARHRIYRFAGAVDSSTAARCMDTLTRWSRIDNAERDGKAKPCDMEVVFFSPGGSVVDGMALYDTILGLRKAGHKITTTCIGYAASMGGILLQAGDVRRMTEESWVLIHEISASAGGSMGAIEDRVEWMKRIQERILAIFADRSKKSKAKDPLTAKQFKEGWNRKDWWLSSEECLKHGIVDEVL